VRRTHHRYDFGGQFTALAGLYFDAQNSDVLGDLPVQLEKCMRLGYNSLGELSENEYTITS
jgi:hypothetical protein